MNNDKRMILAIAVYAAVITMILHTLRADAHEQLLAKRDQYAAERTAVVNPILQAIVFVSKCSGREGLQNGGGFLINEFATNSAHSYECTELRSGTLASPCSGNH